MSKEKIDSWEKVIICFFEYNISDIKSGKKCKLFAAREFIDKKQNDIETEKDAKKLDRLFKAKKSKEEERTKLRKAAPKGEILDWLLAQSKKRIKKGKRITEATHVLKFTHSSAKSESVLLSEKSKDKLLTTSSLKEDLILDMAHNNGALISISRFLNLKLGKDKIFRMIINNNFDFLKPFSAGDDQLKQLSSGFCNLIEERSIKTPDKAKQLYFPLNANDFSISEKCDFKYHILTPLFQTSLAHELDKKMIDLKYGDKQKEIYKLINNENEKKYFHKSIKENIPDTAYLLYGGDYPRNVSMLNASRSGKSYLFSSEPPTWEKQLKPPIYKQSFFYVCHNNNIDENFQYISEFLMRFEDLKSIQDPKLERHLARWVRSIAVDIIFYANTIQNLPHSWSDVEAIKLKKEHQYYLDPFRTDDAFTNEKEGAPWQGVVCHDFAQWMSYKLHKKNNEYTAQTLHKKIWITIFEPMLRDDVDTLELSINYHASKEQA